MDTGLEWAATQAQRIIHDNDVEHLKRLLAEYPALLSWHDDVDDGGLLGMATGAFSTIHARAANPGSDASRNAWAHWSSCQIHLEHRVPPLRFGYTRVKVAAYQAPLLRSGSLAAVDLIRMRLEWCESHGVAILCCPEAILGGLADYAADPREFALAARAISSLARLPRLPATLSRPSSALPR
jgi:hypothetical protein